MRITECSSGKDTGPDAIKRTDPSTSPGQIISPDPTASSGSDPATSSDPTPSLVSSQDTTAQTDLATIPFVLLLALGIDNPEKWKNFCERFYKLVEAVYARVEIIKAFDVEYALKSLTDRPYAILITDPAILNETANHTLLLAVMSYIKTGGTAILCADFAKGINCTALDHFFRDICGLPWRKGRYFRTEVHLNRPALQRYAQVDYLELSDLYSPNASFLKNVDDFSAWYFPSENSVVEPRPERKRLGTKKEKGPVFLAVREDGSLGLDPDAPNPAAPNPAASNPAALAVVMGNSPFRLQENWDPLSYFALKSKEHLIKRRPEWLEKEERGQTPVALTRRGNGWLGYVGDLDDTKGSRLVILGMCRLLGLDTDSDYWESE